MFILNSQLNTDGKVPILFKVKDDCCGCRACEAVCPREAISMMYDYLGFNYPCIDAEKCIRCYSCVKACPIKTADDFLKENDNNQTK